jgi:hypothetical protein
MTTSSLKHKTKNQKTSSKHVIKWSVILVLPLLFLLLFLVNRYEQKMLPGELIPSLGNEHIDNVNSPHQVYNSDPPTSGPHTKEIAPWGIHTTPIPKEILVHNLEDGGIVIYYNSTATKSE